MTTEVPNNSTRLYLTPRLITTLRKNKIGLFNYQPAYEGESAGLDLYNVSKQVVFNGVNKKDSVSNLIPTGLHVCIPQGHVGLLRERGSIVKTPLLLRAGVIDHGFTGEIFVNMINASMRPYTIEAHQKLPVQLLVVPVANSFNLLSKREFLVTTSTSQRQRSQLGSSD